MAKTASIHIHAEPALKHHAAQVLSNLGILLACAINLFLRQNVLHNGIPFDIKFPPQTSKKE
jgi:DNA-damage-inducible protein J